MGGEEPGRGGVVRCDEEKRSVRVKSDRAEGVKEHGGKKNGIVADFAHEGRFVLLVQACDYNDGHIVCQKEIGGCRKICRVSEVEQEQSAYQARDDEKPLRLREGERVGDGFDAA